MLETNPVKRPDASVLHKTIEEICSSKISSEDVEIVAKWKIESRKENN